MRSGLAVLLAIALSATALAAEPVSMSKARQVARYAAAKLDRGSDDIIGHRTYNCRRNSAYKVTCTAQYAHADGSDCYGTIKVTRTNGRYRWDSKLGGCV